jgi:hypothetical protein
MAGLEPAHYLLIGDFKSTASAIPPHRLKKGVEGIEPSSP